MSLITTAEANAYLGLSDGHDNEAMVTLFISAAQEAMEQWCGRCLESQTVTEYLDGNGHTDLYLEEPPESVTSVHVDAGRDYGASTLVSSGDYAFNHCRLIYLDRIWPRGQRNIKVVYKGGFTAVPEDIKAAAKMAVAHLYSWWELAKKGGNILASQSVEGWSQNFIAHSGLPMDVKELLATHRAGRL